MSALNPAFRQPTSGHRVHMRDHKHLASRRRLTAAGRFWVLYGGSLFFVMLFSLSGYIDAFLQAVFL